VDWLRTRADFAAVAPADLSERFVPRQVYGDYLRNLLFWQTRPLAGPERVIIEVIEDEAVDVTPSDRGASVVLKGGGTFPADRVLLATGNLAPRDVVPPGSVEDHPAYCRNPWQGWYEKLPPPDANILLIGTGLTMIDAYLTLRVLGWGGTIYAVSRNGLLPLPHFKGDDYPDFPPDEPWALGLHKLAAFMEEHCARLRARGMNPALAVDRLRPFTQRIWRGFSLEDKREFCRRYRTRWNVVRHRIPPTVAGQIEAAQRGGDLQVLCGGIRGACGEGDRIRVTIEPAGGGPPHDLVVGLLVNCTGPRESYSDAPDALFRNLFQRGLIRPDELDLGIDVTPDFAVVSREGSPSGFLFAVGPLLRGTLWETTAVPELRSQMYQVAQAMLAGDRLQPHDWAPETPEDLVEYYI
jgi:uncharacterized NAD(P)/FAD-binding protein YdhS